MYELIQTRFSKAIQHYDQNALAQKIITDKLFSLIGDKPQKKILEIGCGTGNLSRKLLELNPDTLLLNDICKNYAEMLPQKLGEPISLSPRGNNNSRITFFNGDAQTMIQEIMPAKFSLIASSSAIQWMSNQLRFLIDCKEIMDPDALIAVSTFAPGNLYEIAELEGCALHYHSPSEISLALEPYYKLLHISTQDIVLTFKEPLEVLKHLKMTGVNGIHSKIWTKKHLALFVKEYNRRFRNSDGLCTLTYKPVYLLGKNIH